MSGSAADIVIMSIMNTTTAMIKNLPADSHTLVKKTYSMEIAATHTYPDTGTRKIKILTDISK
jgi:hypothetical protein